ncbi:MAG: hypothetical protein ACRYFX_10260 [Janthinobacterium lividum]
MSTTDQTQLAALRQRVPVGLRHGQALLARTHGNVPTAEALFRAETQALVVAKTGVDAAVAERHLGQHGYDINLTLKSIDEERYTLTERILRRYKHDREEALEKVAYALETAHQLPRNYWLQFEAFPKLPPPLFCVAVVLEWLAYDNWEGLTGALYFHLDLVTYQLDNQLYLPEIAQTLRTAHTLDEQASPERRQQLAALGYWSPGPAFQQQDARFQELRPQLIATLYQLVQDNIRLFP